MAERVALLLRWLRYAEYVIAWEDVLLAERPKYQVVRCDDDWKAKPI